MEVFEGNPLGKWVWANIWKLPLFRLGEKGQSPCTFGDSANIFRTNIEQARASIFRHVGDGCACPTSSRLTIVVHVAIYIRKVHTVAVLLQSTSR